MIPGLELESKVEMALWDAFQGWADHFLARLEAGGVRWLIKDYTRLVESVETQSCSHGPCGQRQTGLAWQHCCGISYEYRNDISVRDAIQLILDIAPKDTTHALAAEILNLDNRLYALYTHCPPRTGRWWHSGLPEGVVE
jgi:hypothetical protein